MMIGFSLPLHYRDDLKSVLIPYGLVQDRIEALARRIFDDLHIDIPEQLRKTRPRFWILKSGSLFFREFSLSLCLERRLSIFLGFSLENSK